MTNTFIVKQDFAIDLSYYEPIWYERANYDLVDPKPKHVIPRATYGIRQDTEFINHWNFWRGKNVPVGAYHYWYGTSLRAGQTPEDSVGDQAENFIAHIIAGGYSGKERLWVDLEEYGNTTVPNGNKYRNLVKQWLDHVERETGQKPGIYSRKDQLERMMVNGLMPTWINDYDMWWAWYPYGPYIDTNIWFPTDPDYRPAWYNREPKIWQYSQNGLIDGFIMSDNHQPTTYDFNVLLDGYLETLELSDPVIPPTEEEMAYKVTTTNNATNIRATGGLPLGNDIGDFRIGQTGYGTEILGGPTDSFYCLKVTAGADVVGWVFSRYNNAPTYATIEALAIPPVENETATVTVTHNGKTGTATIPLV